jgi:hypothetical protein
MMSLAKDTLLIKEQGTKNFAWAIIGLHLFQDAKKYVHGCDSFQRMGQPIRSDEIPLKVQLVIKPFEKWDLDLWGPSTPHLVKSPTSWYAQTMLPNG